jgi:para-nitrobenzyl esterase
VFGSLRVPGMDAFAGSGPAAEGLSGRVMDAWLAFARDGDPGQASLPAWPRHDERTRPTLLLDATPSLAHAPDHGELRLWDGLL